MENETQKRRTYEIIAKWIGEQTGITIAFNEEGKVQCDPKTKRIDLPSNVKAENIYPALAWVMHEAAHIKYTTFDHEPMTHMDPVDFNIVNACEDIRIDRHNMNSLPNIRGFYTEMVKFLDMPSRIKGDAPVEVKVLSDAILMAEGFTDYSSKSPEIARFIQDTSLLYEVEKMVHILQRLERKEQAHAEGEKQIKVIRDILVQAQQQQPQQQPQPSGSPGTDKGNGSKGAPGTSSQSNGGGTPDLDLSALDAVTGNGVSRAIFGTLDKKAGNALALGSASLAEQTRSNFKELLNKTETQRISDGTVIDTDNLVSYFTGDIEELFKEEIVVRHKKSKLLLLLDSSGSMYHNMIDGTLRFKGVAETAKAITDILDEVQQLEGLNVDYEVSRFDNSYVKMNKDTWQQDYVKRISGGTNLEYAFKEAMDSMLKDTYIEGKRMIVLLTDGDVTDSQLENVRKTIEASNADVRAMVIGVDAEINGSFIKKITGHNIISREQSDIVLMEAITEMLEG